MEKEYCHKAQCLACGHSDRVFHTKEEYQEVRVCPKCNGAFVDRWKIHKYINQSQSNEIEIIMTNLNEPPKIRVNGKDIEGIISVSHYYQTKEDDRTSGIHQYVVEYFDKETNTLRTISADRI